MDRKWFYWCAVPLCTNTSKTAPHKVFVPVPIQPEVRQKWLQLAKREDAAQLTSKSVLYFCEDHFDLPNDMENYMQYNIMSSVKNIQMKPGCMPSRFKCHSERRNLPSLNITGSIVLKPQRAELTKEAESSLQIVNKSNAPQQHTYIDVFEGNKQSKLRSLLTTSDKSDISVIKGSVPAMSSKQHKGIQTESKTIHKKSKRIQVCRVCLAVDVKMYNMKDYKLSEMYQNITGISAYNEKESIHRVCWECAARLVAASAFRDKALFSNALLKDQVHMNKNDIATLKQIYHRTLKSPLTIQTVFTSYDIDCGDTSAETKEIELLSDETDANKSKTELRIEKEGTDLDEPFIDILMKTEVESDPIYENNLRIQIVKCETFSETTHVNDSFTVPLDDCEVEIENTKVNDEVFREDYKLTNAPKNYDNDIDLVEDGLENNSIDENNFNIEIEDEKNENFLETTQFNDSFTSPLDDCEDEIAVFSISTSQIKTNNDEVFKENYKITNAPKNDDKDMDLVEADLENNSKLDVIGTAVNESSSEEDSLSLAEVASANKAKNKMNKKIRANRLNNRDKRKIIALKEKGVSVPEIAEETGKSVSKMSGPKPTKRGETWDEDSLRLAMEAVKNNQLSTNAAALKYNIPRRTLRCHLVTGNSTKTIGRPVFTKQLEEDLAKQIKRFAKVGVSVTPKFIKEQAFLFCERLKIKHTFNMSTRMAGRKWLKKFLMRHPLISK